MSGNLHHDLMLIPLVISVTAKILTSAISGSNRDMKVEDLETHLNSLKQMFVKKEKIMEELSQPKIN